MTLIVLAGDDREARGRRSAALTADARVIVLDAAAARPPDDGRGGGVRTVDIEAALAGGSLFGEPTVVRLLGAEALRRSLPEVAVPASADRLLLVEWDGTLPAADPVRRWAERHGTIERYDLPGGAALRAWAATAAAEVGGQPGRGALEELVRRVVEPLALRNELRRLALLRADGAFSRDDVALLVPAPLEGRVFALFDQLVARNAEAVYRTVDELVGARAAHPLQLLAILHKQARTAVLAAAHRDREMAAPAIAAALGVKPYAAQRALAAAAAIDPGWLLSAIVECEAAAKGAGDLGDPIHPDQAFERFLDRVLRCPPPPTRPARR